ncbi:hypothetical protein B0H16DRAFT_1610182 [Mycena metata]|uniref:DUF6534 domain-containing protein n=1 Tax=Mycena metata TaxID=1033252 RepID=A0AAD7HEE0_9AGAR|nr:hypothetical protein B0H16DRAFT_1610182 [Mycena metata]
MPALIDVSSTLGALELGVLLSYLLFGVTTTQSYVYYTRFPNDDWKLKLLVAFVWACEATHSACVAHALYVFTILNYGNPKSLIQALPLTFDTAVLFASIITTVVQGFFAYRIYILGKRRITVPAIVWAISTFRLIACLGIFGAGVRMKSLVTFEAQFGWLMITVWAIGAANDIGITASLVYLLYTQRNEIHSKTVPLIDKLIVWAIETGMMTSACALFTLIFFATRRQNFVWLAIYIITARVFSNSLLASLNGRSTLRTMDAPPPRIYLGSTTTGNPTTKSAQISIGLEFQQTHNRDSPNVT